MYVQFTQVFFDSNSLPTRVFLLRSRLASSVSGTWDFSRLFLLVKTEAKKSVSTPAFSMSYVTRSPASFSNGTTFSLVFSLTHRYLEKPFLLPVAGLGRFSSK